MKLKGKVVRAMFGEGSKSHHMAVFLETAEGTYKLRRPEGNPFVDSELEALVGKTIVGEGEIRDYLFMLTDWDECSE